MQHDVFFTTPSYFCNTQSSNLEEEYWAATEVYMYPSFYCKSLIFIQIITFMYIAVSSMYKLYSISKFQRWLLNFSCSDWSRWTAYLAIVSSLDYHISLEIVLKKEVSDGDWKLFVSCSFQSPIGIIIFDGWFLINNNNTLLGALYKISMLLQ